MLLKQDLLPLRTIGTPVSPKISWKLQVVLTWGQRQVVLYPKGSNIWKNDSFWTGRNLVVLKGLDSINKTTCSSNIPEERRNMCSKIPENKKLTNQLENIRKIKHHLYLQNRIEIQGNASKDTSMESVNNRKNSNKISTSEHLTKSSNHKTKTEATEIKELNSTPTKNITEETTAESFYNTFDKKDQNAATETLKEKVANQTSEIQNGEKEEVDQRAKESKETVLIVGDSMIKKIDGYLLTKSINQKFLVKVSSFKTAKTIDMYDHLKPTLRDFNPGLFIIHVGTNDLSLNKTSNEVAEEIVSLAESVKKPSSNIVVSDIVTHEDGYKTKVDEVNKILEEIFGKKGTPLIRNNNINSKRHINRSRLHLNDTGVSALVRRFKAFLANFE